MITVDDLTQARVRIASKLTTTPIISSPVLSAQTNAQVYLKLDNFQRTGSFKERGAVNRLLTLTKDQTKNGVVTASAGNHAQAVAYHATQLGISSTIFMPRSTPLLKVSRTEAFGAKIVIAGENYDEAFDAASEFAAQTGAFYVHAYDDEKIIAGQATLGFEVFEQLPQIDVMLVPVGGGGLISGVALAAEASKRSIRIIGVETDVLPSLKIAIEKGSVVQLPAAPTLADGIRVRRAGKIALEICQRMRPEWITVRDDSVALAILQLMEQEKLVAEGAGAAGVAALLNGQIKGLEKKNICIVISGGNIDVTLLSRVIERGMVETGRLVKLALSVHDRPGELAELLRMIGQCEANVLEVHHERAFAASAWNDVEVDLVLETKGKTHIQDLLSKIEAKGYSVTQVDNAGANGWLRPHHA